MVTVFISAIACTGTIALALIKPQIKIRGYDVSIFFIPALLGALMLLFLGLLSWHEAANGLMADSDINPLKILALFLSMTLLSVFLDEMGFFRYLANLAVQKCGGNQVRLFIIFYCMVSALTVFTSNDVVILTFTPFICYFAKNANVDSVPYLVSEFVAANTASMLLIIGNPTNIYLGTMAGIDFFAYLKVMALPALFAVVMAFAVLYAIFRKRLKQPVSVMCENVVIKQKTLLVFGLVMLIVCTLMLTVSGFIHIPMWLISVAGFTMLVSGVFLISLFIRRRPVELFSTVVRTPWEVIPLVISMFIIVLALESSGTTEKIAELLNSGNTLFTYGIASTLAANLINNIPMSVLFSSLLMGSGNLTATYAAVIGSNIGAYLTPIGALAGVMWLGILRSQGIKFGFGKFVAYGLCVAVPTLFAALLGLLLAGG
ncbi:MAG: SLC13 family permease [Chitinispirillia bacterium]|nr:SLC13 family permease [Chitinispirillia bacterium]MCL2267610.1 SLC13 family permease [Chitinispirillia bacterium]